MFLESLEYLEVNDKKIPFFCSIDVLNDIQEKFGKIENWGEQIDETVTEGNYEALMWTTKEFANEGIEIYNDELPEQEEELQLFDDKAIGRLIAAYTVNKTVDMITKTYIKCISGNEKN